MNNTSTEVIESFEDLSLWRHFFTIEGLRVVTVSIVLLFYPNLLNIISFYSKEKKKVFDFFSKVTEIIRPIVSGLIIAFYLANLHNTVLIYMKTPSLEIIFSQLLPILLLTIVLLLVSVCYFFSSVYCREENKEYKGINFIIENVSSESQESVPFTRSMKERVGHCNYLSGEIGFYNNFSAIIYLSLTFFHGFFIGLGFSGQTFFDWFEIIIYLYKFIEFFRLRLALKKLNLKKSATIFLVFLFSFTAPIGIILRGLFTDFGRSLEKSRILIFCDNFFIISSFFMVLVELGMMYPKKNIRKALHIAFTLLSAILSCLMLYLHAYIWHLQCVSKKTDRVFWGYIFHKSRNRKKQ